MRNILAVIIGVIMVISVSGCDNLYNGITDELNINYFHGFRQLIAGGAVATDRAGESVAVSADGSTVVFGAIGDDDMGTDSGAAYVFRWNGSSWVQVPKLMANDGVGGECFGHSVAVSADGNTVVVGAYQDDSNKGSAYVYRWNGSSYDQAQWLTADVRGAYDQFGWSVAVSADGGTVVVGAKYGDGRVADSGSAFVYRWNGTSYAQAPKLKADDGAVNDYFGVSVSVSGDGGTVVVGANGDDSAKGSAYVYRWNGSTYEQSQKLTASDGATSDNFGLSVAVSGDGNTVVVGATGDDDKGTDSGAAYVFRVNGSSWGEMKLTASDGEASDNFGQSVAISADGSKVVTGAYRDDSNKGSAYVHRWNGSSYDQSRKLMLSDGLAGGCFGWCVAVSGDGGTVVAGANTGSYDFFSVWMYAE